MKRKRIMSLFTIGRSLGRVSFSIVI
jgi:hypothetical protein